MSEAGLRPPLLLLLLVAAAASLAGRHGNACPAPCQCHRGLLNCSRAALPTGLHRLLPPGPAARNQTFFFLDFSGNSISSIEKRVWKGYPWAEYLVLKDNDLSKLQKDSLEGLLSLKHLDLSCNKILFIEKHAFEPLPFLQYINLGGNLITELRYGTFQAWHGMQFLQKLVLSHNPLSIIADTSFFELPSLKYLSFQKLSQERNSKFSSEAIHQVPGVSESSSMEKPLWLRDMYLPLDSIRKKSMAQKLYERESSDEEEIFNRADVRRQYEWSSSKESY
ncbi:acetylcholinesterase-like [Platysternon megacephalum]|uniref:Acetylcholinesterase-like n=1 Tax=Platysternon megacephalum TaxID=55544 RepID=A0A4D9DMF1_9SAUR|nr:acetylcholinesterase-like [Platysternon megacephalum]